MLSSAGVQLAQQLAAQWCWCRLQRMCVGSSQVVGTCQADCQDDELIVASLP